VGCFERGNETLDFIRCCEFIDGLRNFELLKSTSWNYLASYLFSWLVCWLVSRGSKVPSIEYSVTRWR
jgi:hypothetical protein